MLNKQIILMLAVILSILSLLVFVDGWTAPFLPPDTNATEELPPQIEYDSTLKIVEVNAEVDGKTDTIQNNGEKISREAKQESKVNLEIDVKNIWDKKLKDIDVAVTIKDIDDGDDLKEDASINSLDAGNSKKVDVSFDLPLKVDDGSYDVKINVRGKDNDNKIHGLDWTLMLEVKKEKNKVEITKALLFPSTIKCGRSANLQIGLLNLGRDEEKVKLEIKNEYLGINIKEENIELDTGTDDKAEYEKTFSLGLPNSVESGAYTVSMDAYYNNGKSVASKKLNLFIEDCSQTKQTGLSTKSLPPSASETLGKYYQQPKTSGKTIISTVSDESIILLLTIILILILGLIIFLLGVIIIQLRR